MKQTFTLLLTLLIITQAHADEYLRQVAQEHDIECKSGNCPEGIGTLLTTGLGLVYCRAFLKDSQTVVTNAHCIEPLLEQKSCNGEVYFKFGNQVGECDEILRVEFTPEDTSEPDIAILKLKNPIDIEPVIVQPSTFEDEQDLYFYRSLYDFQKNASSMEKINCKTKMNSSAVGRFFNSNPLTISISECPFQEGDSGSPIFNKSDEVVALLQGGLGEDALKAFSRIPVPGFNNASYIDVLLQNATPETVKFFPVIVATNLSCIFSNSEDGVCEKKLLMDYMKSELLKLKKEYEIVLNQYISQDQFALDSSDYDKLLREANIQTLSPADFKSIVQAKVDCSSLEKNARIPVQVIESKVDSYFRIHLVTSYDEVEMCSSK